MPLGIRQALAIPANNRTWIDRGRRAYRRADAGEPFVRSLLRHAARRARFRRHARGRRCRTASPCFNQPIAAGAGEVLPFHPGAPNLGLQFLQDLPHDWVSGQGAFHGGRYDQWVPFKGTTTMAYLHARRHPVPLSARRRLHDLRRVPLLDEYIDRSEPLLHVDRLGRQRRHRRRPGDRQRGSGLRLVHVSRSAARARASRGRSIRTSAPDSTRSSSWGWTRRTRTSATTATTRCSTSTQYQNAQPGSPLYEKARTRHERGRRRRLLRHPEARRANEHAAASLVDRRAGSVLRASELARELRRVVHRSGLAGAHVESRRCGARPRCSSTTTKTTASSITSCRRSRRRRAQTAFRPSIRRTRFFRAARNTRAVRMASDARVPMLVVSPWSKGG